MAHVHTPASDSLQRLLDEEPFVRSLARAIAGQDADDVVQRTWLQAIAARAPVIRRPRSWLARVVRGIASNFQRARIRRERHESFAARSDSVPSSAELMEREERRRMLVAAVDELPELERAIVLLRYFQDQPPRVIAARLGIPVAVVYARLRNGLSLLRRQLAREHGDCRAWLLPLLGAPTSTAAATIGVLVMTTKAKIVASLATVLMLAGVWVVSRGGASLDRPRPADTAGFAAAAATAENPAAATGATSAASTRREAPAAPVPVRASTGSLRVRLRYADEPRPAADVPVILNRPGGDFRVGTVRGRTDAEGIVRFDAMPTGAWEVSTGRALGPMVLAIRAGESTDCDLELMRGLDVAGIVVDDNGMPIPGALVEVGEPWRRDPEVLAITDTEGRFALRACPSVSLVGARAAGFASSSLQSLHSPDGAPVQVRLELVERGGVVEGFVAAADGSPVPDAVVRVGKGRTDHLDALAGGGPPLPAQVRTDLQGRFRAIGVAAGRQPVQVRAVGFAPFSGSCDVAAGLVMPLHVTLGAGAQCQGSVATADGAPAADLFVQVGSKGDFVQLFARTAADGSFTLRDLPAGEVELRVVAADRGKAEARITTAAGATVPCELRLTKGQELRGRVVDEADQPVADLDVQVVSPAATARGIERAMTDRDGRFVLRALPAGCRVDVRVFGRTFDAVRRTGVDPTAGELLLRVQNPPRSAFLRGLVLGIDGRPAPDVGVEAHWQQTSGGMHVTTRADGSFEIGPLRAGGWRLRIIEQGCAAYRSPALTLAANAMVDLGTIRLHRGGHLEVEVAGAPPEQLALVIYDDRDQLQFGMTPTNLPLRSLPLNPGGYALRVRGNGLAAQSLPFTIRDGERTRLQVAVAPGRSQRFEFLVPAGDTTPAWFTFEVRRGCLVVLTGTASSGQDFAAEHWLAPGDYEVVVTDYDLRGNARFTVRGDAGPPIVVPVR